MAIFCRIRGKGVGRAKRKKKTQKATTQKANPKAFYSLLMVTEKK